MRSRPRSITPAARPTWAPWSSHFTARFGLQRVALVGYSMGGNLVLKLAGEWGARPPLVAVATVCPAIDLAAGADALHEPSTASTSGDFLRGLDAPPSSQSRALSRHLSNSTASAPSAPSASSTRKSSRAIATSRCRRLLLPRRQRPRYRPHRRSHAHPLREDDPFIRLLPETRARILANPHIALCRDPPWRPLRLPGAPFRRRPLGRGHRGPLPSGCRRRIRAPSPPRRTIGHFAATINNVGE